MADDFGIGKALVIPQSVLNNITKIDDKINQIASDSEKMGEKFTSAILKMGNGAGDLLKKLQAIHDLVGSIGNVNIKGLESAAVNMGNTANEAERAANGVAKVATSINRFGSGMNIAELTQRIKELNDQLTKGRGAETVAEQQAIVNEKRRLEEELRLQKQSDSEKQDLREKSLERELKRADKELAGIKKLEDERIKSAKRVYNAQASIDSKLRKLNYNSYVTSTEGSLRTADKANTYAQRAIAIKNIEAAMKRLNVTDSQYAANMSRLTEAHKRLSAQQREVEKNMGRIVSSQRNLMNTSDQLARKLALIFSVSQITGYVNNLVRVRGEFELQNTALASILQNKEKADKLFAQITELAIKSPFTVKELTTYTKSLSAYSVEYEKLYDTTKMLADVSAGLGVDMQRLILAFGQVKAANFLRGCLGYGTPVMLYDGTIKQVQDIVVGDVLINEKGEPVNVLELIRGRETMFLVEQVSGHNRTSYRVNRNHILTLWNVQEQRLEDVYVYDYLKNTEAYLGLRIVDGEKVYYDIEVTKDRIDDYYGFVLDGNKRFRLGDGTITHNTETRQFTEAGINMIGELAKYYSELEGRIVSVNEVMDRQFKRMISFQDVEQVFKRLTSAGGMFYNMQETQAETLAGMMSNLQDRIDLMFNSLGKEYEGTIKGVVELLQYMVENYEVFANLIKASGALFVLYKLNVLAASESLTRFAYHAKITNGVMVKQLSLTQLANVGWLKMAKSIKTAGLAIKSFVSQNLILLAFTALAGAIYEAVHWNDEFNERIDELNKKSYEAEDSLNKISKAYDNIAKSAKQLAKEKGISEVDFSYSDSDYKQLFAQLKKLDDELQDRGYTLPIKIEFVTPKNIDEAMSQREEIARLANDFSKSFNEALISAETKAEIGGLIGDNLETDLKQLSDSYERINGEFKSNLNIIENELSRISPSLTGQAKEYYNQLQGIISSGKEDTKSLLERVRLIQKISYYANLAANATSDEAQNSRLSVKFRQMITNLSNTRNVVLKNEKELEYEINNLIDELIEKYGSLDELKKQYAKYPMIITAEIKAAFDEKELSQEAKRMATFLATQRLQVPVELIPKSNLPTFFGDFRDTVKTLDKEGIFDKTLQSMKDIQDLEKSIQDGYAKEIEYLDVLTRSNTKRLDLSKEIAEQESIINDSVSSQEAKDAAKLNLQNLQKQKEVIEGSNKAEIEAAKRRVEEYKNIAAAFNLQYEKTRKATGTRGEDKELKRLQDLIKLIEEAKKKYDELNKELSSEESAKYVRDMFKGTEAESIIATMTFDTSGVIKGINTAFKNVAKNASEQVREGLEKAADEAKRPYETELRLNPVIEKREDIEKQIENMFSGYELSIELNKTGVPTDIIEDLLGIQEVDFDLLKEKIMSLKPVFEKQGLNWEDLWEKTQKRLAEIEQKELNERLKRYAEYLKKTVSERVAIEIEAQKEIAKVQTTQNLTTDQKSAISKRIREEYNKKLDKQSWEDFKGTDIYIKMFEDLEFTSSQALDLMQSKLLALKGSLKNLDPSDLKEIVNQLSKIEEIRIQKNPFGGLVDNLKEYIEYQKNANELNDAYVQSINKEDYLKRSIDDLQLSINAEEERYRAIKKTNGANSEESKLAKANLDIQRNALKILLQELVAQKLITEEFAEQISKGEHLTKTLQDRLSLIGSYFQEFSSGITEIASNLENVFGSMSDATKDSIDSIAEIAGGAGSAFEGISRAIANPGDVGAYVQALQGITQVIGAIFNIGDKAKERQIQRELELVEDLQRAYEKLEKAIDDAYSLDTYKEATDKSIENLKQQNEAIKKAMAAESDKKKVDEDRLKELQQQHDDNLELIEENMRNAFNFLTDGVLENVISAASEFTDAWLEAFKETGDGLSGLNESFDELMLNIIKKQATMAIVSPFIKNIETELKKYINENDYDFTTEDAKKIAAYYNSLKGVVNENLKNFFEAFQNAGINIFGDSTDSLSGLSKSIQGITEDTAEVLASITESIRYFVSDSNSVQHSIYNWLINPPVESPLYSEIRQQTILLNAINSLLIGVSKNVPSNGKAIKVQIV